MRRALRDLDWPLLGLSTILLGIGFLLLASATRSLGGPWSFIRTRALHLAVAVLAMIVVAAIDYRSLARFWRILLAVTLVMLVGVLVVGETRLGAQRWIVLGPFGAFQPSELAKVALILTLAAHLNAKPPPQTVWSLAPYVLHFAIPAALVMRQPDLGTTMVLGAIFLGMLFMAGTPLGVLGSLGAIALTAVPFAWSVLHDYQRARLLVFLDPSVDPLGAGYAITQSKIAVGSGQLWGKGLFAGTQNLLRFIPEQHTDFIFTVVGEELGFVGAVVILTLFLLWIWRALRTVAIAGDRLGQLIATGIVSMVLFHVFVNVGMTVGLMPITGIPLPFLSYGGSSLLAMGIAIGTLLSIGRRRRKILY